MPYINVKLTPEGLSPQVKEELMKELTDVLVKKLGKNPDTTIVIIDEIETDNWGIAGESVTNRRSK